MDTAQIIAALRDERDRIDRAINLLTTVNRPRRGRRAGTYHMSAAARKRISQAMKARWAAKKKP
jgi:hypothetical protein